MFEIIVFFAALIASFFASMAGGGGGLIVTPALMLMGLPLPVAVGTAKTAVTALGIGSALRYSREKFFERNFILYMTIAGLPGTILGAHLALLLPEQWGPRLIGGAIILLCFYSAMTRHNGLDYTPRNRTTKGYLIGGSVTFLIAIMSGMMGAGMGLVATAWNIRWFGLDYKRAVAYTLLVVGLIWNGVAAVTYMLISEIMWSWVPFLAAGYFIGSYAGAHVAILKGNVFIKRVFEAITLILGLKLLFS